jgi:transposase
MNIHQHARTTPRSRELLVQHVQWGAESVSDVAEALSVSERTVRKWVQRYRTEGAAGLQDRSCRPRRQPTATAPELAAWVLRLRRQRWTGAQIARALRLSRATVARVLQRHGLNRLRALEPAAPVQRYEYARPAAWCTWTSRTRADRPHRPSHHRGSPGPGPGHRLGVPPRGGR